MADTESDEAFVERIKREWDGDNVPCVEDFDQLIALARRGAAMQWRPIEEAPKDGFEVLVYVPRATGALYITASNPTGQQWWSRNVGAVKPTHWMPLPPPPTGEQG